MHSTDDSEKAPKSTEERVAELEASHKKMERLIKLQSQLIEDLTKELGVHKGKICGLKNMMDKFAKEADARIAKAEHATTFGFINYNTNTPSYCFPVHTLQNSAGHEQKPPPCAAAKSSADDDDA